MRLAIASAFFLVACAPTSKLVPSHPAVARYQMNLETTRAAVRDALADHSLHVDEAGADAFATGLECRTVAGDLCPGKRTAWTRTADRSGSVETVGFQITARVVPTDNGVLVRIGARLEQHGQQQVLEVGDGEVPAWAQHEVDGVLVAVAHKLAPPASAH